MEKYDKIIIGAGLYGLYSALFCLKRGERVLVLEKDDVAFSRATYINQARVHMGYHYPRSISTALKSRGYFERFVSDFSYCIASDFLQVYAISSRFSWTDAARFEKFCRDADIPCESISPDKYFKKGLCEGAYITREYAFDAHILKYQLLRDVNSRLGSEIRYGRAVTGIERDADDYVVYTASSERYSAPFVLNTTYAGCNELITLAGFEPIKIKYELCEIILCDVARQLYQLGITVMDGPFFSIMPFGKTGIHSLTSVTFTPHKTSYQSLPTFACQQGSGNLCSPESLQNCDYCEAKPQTAYPYMQALAKKYLLEQYGFSYKRSMFSIKPIMMASEVDDSRPTVIRVHSQSPTFVSVLSGKINTVYDLDEVLTNG